MKDFKTIIFLFAALTIGCSKKNKEAPAPQETQTVQTGDQNQDGGTPVVTPTPIHIEKFNDLIGKIHRFTQDIPDDSKSYIAGRAYNTFLEQAYDPFSSMRPVPDPPRPK